MGRKTVHNNLVLPEIYAQVLENNKNILSEFIEYLSSVDKSLTTIKAYEGDIKYFFIWNFQKNNNKSFTDLIKRDIMKYQNYLLNELKLSSNRIRGLKSAISSMSNFIESMMDDLYPDFKNIINKIPAPVKQNSREKTVLSEEQVQFLLDYLVENKKYQQACAFALAVASGARKSELLRFKVSFFKDEYIKNGLYKTPELIKTKGRSSKGKMLNKYVLANQFKSYFELWMIQRLELGIVGEELFWTRYDSGWKVANISTFDSWAEKFGEILNVDFYFHSLRHYFTTQLCKNNIPAEIIKDIIGWQNTSLISLYNDSDSDDEMEKYFDKDGIKEIKSKSIKQGGDE